MRFREWKQWWRSLKSDDHGFSTLEATIVIPFLLAFTVFLAEYITWNHHQQLMVAAASDAARVAAADWSTGGDPSVKGRSAAVAILNGTSASVSDVSVVRNGDIVTASVSGRAELLYFTVSITETAQAPVERFIPAGG